MTIQQLIDYLETLPDKSESVAFSEWREDGYYFVTPPNLPMNTWKPFERFGRTFRPVLSWDNCLAHKIPERLLVEEALHDA